MHSDVLSHVDTSILPNSLSYLYTGQLVLGMLEAGACRVGEEESLLPGPYNLLTILNESILIWSLNFHLILPEDLQCKEI